MRVAIYTDGAAKGNPGKGGYGIVLLSGKLRKELSKGFRLTTNNRMELQVAVEGLKALKRATKVELWTDSQYVRRGITEWIQNWVKNQWRNAAKKPVKNTDLWQQLLEVTQKHQISWHWVKGHSGDVHNERVDQAAREAAEKLDETSEAS